MAGGRWPGLTSAGKTQLERLGAVFNARPRRKPCCPVSTGAKDVFIWAATPARR